MTAIRLFIGGLTRIDNAGQSTGIYKHPAAGPILLGPAGLAGDVQADRRVHGGPEKAVHHYAAENHARLAGRFPAIAGQLIPGSIGENVSTTGWDERSVFIGDVFGIGHARVQVSQPRSPCWKIDERYATGGMARFIAETGLTGWYYRVLVAATVANGAQFEHLERLPRAVSLAELWQIWTAHRPEPAALARIAEAPGLTPGWRKKLLERRDWLRANAGSANSVNSANSPKPAFHAKPDSSSPT